MVKSFYYRGHENPGNERKRLRRVCDISMSTCKHKRKNGQLCRNKIPTGWDYCHLHMPANLHLQVKDSVYLQEILQDAKNMKGLFVYAPQFQPNDTIFIRGDHICDYGGETLTREQVNARLHLQPGAKVTAPYTTTGLTANLQVNASCKRGLGSMINHCDDRRRRNCSLKINEETGQVWIMASKNLKNNTELLTNYDFGLRPGEPGYDFYDHRHATRSRSR